MTRTPIPETRPENPGPTHPQPRNSDPANPPIDAPGEDLKDKPAGRIAPPAPGVGRPAEAPTEPTPAGDPTVDEPGRAPGEPRG